MDTCHAVVLFVCSIHLSLTTLTSPPSSSRQADDSNSGVDADDAESATQEVYESSKELLAWREAVASVSSSSQLACCILKLSHSIAWEKSIMKVVRLPHSLNLVCSSCLLHADVLCLSAP